MAKKKFYAIRKGNGVKNRIVSSWEECKKLVNGYTSEYKSFSTAEAAYEYLRENTKNNKELSKIHKPIEPPSKSIEVPIIKEDPINNTIRTDTIKKERPRCNTTLLSFKLENKLIEEFIAKCDSMSITKERAIKLMIEEWLY